MNREVFTLDRHYKSIIDAEHDIEFEKSEILQEKLLAIMQPPFTNIELEKLLSGKVDDWCLKSDEYTIAIEEKTIEIPCAEIDEKYLSELKKERDYLKNQIYKNANNISIQHTRRIEVGTDAAREFRRYKDRTGWDQADEDIIDIQIDETPRNGHELVRSTHSRNQHRKYDSYDITLPDRIFDDIEASRSLLRYDKYELESIDNQIEDIEEAMKSNGHVKKIKYCFKKGQIVPDDYEEILKCQFSNIRKQCWRCKHYQNCKNLEKHHLERTYRAVLREYRGLESKIELAQKLNIDIDSPLSVPFDIKWKNAFNNFTMDDYEYLYTSSGRNCFSVVFYNTANNSKIELPLFDDIEEYKPNRLYNADYIYSKRGIEIFFTDCLVFADYFDKHDDEKRLFASYYGAQFEDSEIDTFSFRGRTVHYLIFQHSGLSKNDVIQKACDNYLQLINTKGIKLDFWFLENKNHNDVSEKSYVVSEKLTAEEFFQIYVKKEADNITPSNSNSQTSGNNCQQAKTGKMLLAPYILEEEYMLLAGGKHTGKTTLSAFIAASVASGKEIVKIIRPERGKRKAVLYLDMELGENRFNKYVRFIEDIAGAPLKDLPLHIEHMNGSGINIHTQKGTEKIEELVSRHFDKDLKLVIIDNITAVSGHGGSDSIGWNNYTFPFVTELMNKGITVIIIAHVDEKEVMKGGQQKLMNASECILLKKAKGDKETESIRKNIIKIELSKNFGMNNFPYEKNPLLLSFDENAKKPKWEFNEDFLIKILKQEKDANLIGSWFNVTAKTVREWKRNYKIK
ncbi:MAG: AAA family ATPase [Victivallales bacterium]|nr:AAA family ATPase [Victivallales bacterium]